MAHRKLHKQPNFDILTEGNQKLPITFALERRKRHNASKIIAIKWIFLLQMQYSN